MNKAISILLLFVISIQTGYAIGVSVWFFMNREKIAEKYCVNKNRPTLNCNGKCYLSKKMKEAAAEDNAVPIPDGIHFVKAVTGLLNEVSFSTQIISEADSVTSKMASYNNHYELLLVSEIFHPPGRC